MLLLILTEAISVGTRIFLLALGGVGWSLFLALITFPFAYFAAKYLERN